MRVARASMLLAAAAMLVCGLHLTLALPAEVAEKPVKEAVAPRDPEEHHAEEHHQEHPPSSGGGFHIPRPSEIIHAVGSYVQGSHYQHVQEHHDQHVQSAHEHAQAAHEHVEEHHNEHHRPTHRPPHRPLHRPHGEKDKIKATKTVLVEFTKRVTRHPVCMKVYGVKPPCLPFEAYSSKGVQNKPCQHGLRDDNNAAEEEEDDFYGEPELKEGLYISPSAAVELPSVTKLVDTPDDLEETARSARYLELRAPAAPAAPAAAAAPASATPALPAEQTARQHLIAGAADAIHTGASGLLGHHNKPDVIVEYHTLWVTKVEKVWDHRVTATLVAENCVPTDSKIPFCGGHGYGPTYEGGDEIVYKPAHKPVYKPVHKPVHQEPVHKPVHHEPVHKPVHHEPVHKPVHHEPVHKPVHHEPVHHEPAHKPVHHEPAHKPVHHEPVHKPVHHEPAYKPVHHEPAHKPEQGVEYSEGPEDHHWKEGEEESNNATEEVNDNAEAARTESSE